jgi:hypothetical protein
MQSKKCPLDGSTLQSLKGYSRMQLFKANSKFTARLRRGVTPKASICPSCGFVAYFVAEKDLPRLLPG